MLIGLLLGLTGSAFVGLAAHEHRLEPALPDPWLTASLALVVLLVGWVVASVSRRFAAALAGALLPGVAYGAVVLAGDGNQQLAYGWSAVAAALGWVAVTAGLAAPRNRRASWSSRRRTAPRIPRARAH